jgi:hypothetical protein
MKKVIIEVPKPSKAGKDGKVNTDNRENTVREIAKVVTGLPLQGKFQVTISNAMSTYDLKAQKLRVSLRVIAGQVEKHAKAQGKVFTSDQAYFLAKKQFILPIVRTENTTINFHFELLEHYIASNNMDQATGKRLFDALIHAVVDPKKIDNQSLSHAIDSIKKFWISKEVNLETKKKPTTKQPKPSLNSGNSFFDKNGKVRPETMKRLNMGWEEEEHIEKCLAKIPKAKHDSVLKKFVKLANSKQNPETKFKPISIANQYLLKEAGLKTTIDKKNKRL